MSACEAILLEVSFVPLFPGIPLMHDVVEFMRQRGFFVYDVMGIYRMPHDDVLGQLDLMFVRSGHPLRETHEPRPR
jgi:hypothetical protein